MTLYRYKGDFPIIYSDYLGVPLSDVHTLSAEPGGIYMITNAEGSAPHPIPPDDGRWEVYVSPSPSPTAASVGEQSDEPVKPGRKKE